MLDYNAVSGDVKWNSEVIARLSKSETLIFAALLKKLNQFSSKEELIEEGWPNKFVSPNSLAVAIKNIRKVLQETDGVFNIETVHRRGYILHGETDKVQSNMIAQQPPVDSSENKYEINTESKTTESCSENVDDAIIYMAKVNEKSIAQKRHSNYLKKIFIKILSSLYCVAILSLSIIYFFSSGELYCYQLNEKTKICGVFELNKSKQQSIADNIPKKSGIYLYGYDNNDQDIKVHSVD
ncbi:helix-turn-helix domain-containing protein [Aeromonas jandaei]|uniref:winged helix-turn-helix domain-containing protein n=1 Tax=Aeromonas jandaei TaxID=650 RepID=UPI00191F74F0|nr:helix-turn-helix domain-containing protein [Aeromonas jandaei]MBL0665615.1 helix-turn-helix domain-containing protein [Aeromonas jandaei]